MSELRSLSPEEMEEIPMVELAYMLLLERKEPISFEELLKEIAALKNYSPEQIQALTNRLYTEINVDGRFVYVGDSLWGIKKWYPIEQFEEAAPVASSRKRKAVGEDLDGYDEYDEYEDELDEAYDEDYEDYDEYGEEEEDFDRDYDEALDEEIDTFDDAELDVDLDDGQELDLDLDVEEEPPLNEAEAEEDEN